MLLWVVHLLCSARSAQSVTSTQRGQASAGARLQLMRHIDWGGERRYRRRRYSQPVEPQPIDAQWGGDRKAAEYEAARSRSYGVGPAWHSLRRKLGDKLLMPDRPWIDLGAGFNFDLDHASLLPKVVGPVCAGMSEAFQVRERTCGGGGGAASGCQAIESVLREHGARCQKSPAQSYASSVALHC